MLSSLRASKKTFFFQTNGHLLQELISKSKETSLDLCQVKDANGFTALHFAVAQGDVQSFYNILHYLKSQFETNSEFTAELQNWLNTKGESPWHLAARLGKLDFFAKPSQSEQEEMWQLFKPLIAEIEDGEGNSVLHAAIVYETKSNQHNIITIKKKLVRQLIHIFKSNVYHQNRKGQTALHVATQLGCYVTAAELLKSKSIKKKENKSESKEKSFLDLEDRTQKTAYAIAAKEGRQRLENAILFYKDKKAFKTKEGIISRQEIIEDAKNVYLSDEEFIKRLKLAKVLDYKDVIEIIQIRSGIFRKKYRRSNLKLAIMGALCPAVTLAAFIGSFGGLNPEPILGAIITLAVLPFVYLPFIYTCYKACSYEYSKMAAETLYFTWLSTKLAMLGKKFKSDLLQLTTRLEELTSRIKIAKNRTDLSALKKEYETIKLDYKSLCEKLNEVIEIPHVASTKKTKIKLSQLSRNEFKHIKNLGNGDAKNNAAWVKPFESVKAFITANDDILCPLGAGLTIATSISTIFTSKVGLLFLGATAAAFLTTPAGIALVSILATLLLGALIGFIIYKTSTQKTKASMGKLNRELVLAYDACKRNCDLDKVTQLKNHYETCLSETEGLFTEKEREFPVDEIAKTQTVSPLDLQKNTLFSIPRPVVLKEETKPPLRKKSCIII